MFEGAIILEKAIFHIVDRKKDKIILKDDLLDLKNEKLVNILTKQIVNTLDDSNRIFAEFNQVDNKILFSLNNFLDDENVFIVESQNITRKLAESMKGTNATSANFFIIKFKRGNSSAIALIKLNFQEVFYSEESISENGKTKVKIVLNDKAFYEKQKLEKCMILYLNEGLNTFDKNIPIADQSTMLILDRQNIEVSDFFGNKFLDIKLLNEKRQSTKAMFNEINDFLEDEIVDPLEYFDKKHIVSQYFSDKDEFLLGDLMKVAFDENGDKEKIDKLNKTINDKKISANFNIDSEYTKKNKYQTIRTEEGIIIKMPVDLEYCLEYCTNQEVNEYNNEKKDIMLKGVKLLK